MKTKKYIRNKLKSRRRRGKGRKTRQRGGNPKVEMPMDSPTGPPPKPPDM